MEENDLEEEIGLADEFREKAYRAIFDSTKAIEAKRTVRMVLPLIKTAKVAPTIPVGIDPHPKEGTGDAPCTVDFIREHISKVKLPKLITGKFNGELTKWLTFWDSYKSSVHSNQELLDGDRFNYLYSLLEGPALEAISGLKLTAVHYPEAIAVLTKRFSSRQ